MIASNLQEFYSNLVKGAPIIAIDYGIKKTGIAISNREHTFAMPFMQINLNDERGQLNEIINLVSTRNICGIVIGLPISMSGVETEQTKIVRNFAEKLSKLINLPIYLQD